MKLRSMKNKGEGIVGTTGSSQDLTRKVNKTCRCVIWGLRGIRSESDKHDLIMSRRRGHIQHDGWRNGYGIKVKVRNIVYVKESLQQAVLEETTIRAMQKEGTAVLEHLKFFDKVIIELLAVDVKID